MASEETQNRIAGETLNFLRDFARADLNPEELLRQAEVAQEVLRKASKGLADTQRLQAQTLAALSDPEAAREVAKSFEELQKAFQDAAGVAVSQEARFLDEFDNLDRLGRTLRFTKRFAGPAATAIDVGVIGKNIAEGDEEGTGEALLSALGGAGATAIAIAIVGGPVTLGGAAVIGVAGLAGSLFASELGNVGETDEAVGKLILDFVDGINERAEPDSPAEALRADIEGQIKAIGPDNLEGVDLQPKILAGLSDNELVAAAENNAGVRFALDRGSLIAYENDLEVFQSEENALGRFTKQYLEDRAAFVQKRIEALGGDTGGDFVFVDRERSTVLGARAFTAPHVVFGSQGEGDGTGPGDIITGFSENDRLYGRGGSDIIDGVTGNDRLDGGRGDDILKGGSGDDTYVYIPGDGQDRIIDRDGKGKIVVGRGENRRELSAPESGPTFVEGNKVWESDDGQFTFTLKENEGFFGDNSELVISGPGLGEEGEIVIEDFEIEEGQLGLNFDDPPEIDLVESGEKPFWLKEGGQPNDGQASLVEGRSRDFTVKLRRRAKAGETVQLSLEGDVPAEAFQAVHGGFGLGLFDEEKSFAGGVEITLEEGQEQVSFTLENVQELDEIPELTLRASFAGVSSEFSLNVDGMGEGPTDPGQDARILGDGEWIDTDGDEPGIQPELDRFDNREIEPDTAGTQAGQSDVLSGGNGDETVEGFTGNDLLFAGSEGEDRVSGGEGDDIVQAGQGSDVLEGGAGTDVVMGDPFMETSDSAGNDQLFGETEVSLDEAIERGNSQGGTGERGDLMHGGGGDDLVVGAAGDDALAGGAGADTLVGGAGDDVIEADGGFIVDYEFVGDPNGNDDSTDFSQWDTSGLAWQVEVSSMERPDGVIEYEVSVENGQVFGLDESGSDRIHAGNGDDVIDAGGSDDRIRAGAGVDVVFGGAGRDNILGGEGDDRLNGDNALTSRRLHGSDFIAAGIGDDEVFGQGGADVLLGGAGADELVGDSDVTNAGDDEIHGGAGADEIVGHAGGDTVTGGAGADVIFGDGGDIDPSEQGDDRLSGGPGDDTITAGHGNDVVSGGSGDDELFGTAGDNDISGGSGDDRLEGDGGQEVSGDQHGRDTLRGGAGADILVGAGGRDMLHGGEGDDRIGGDAANLDGEFHADDRIVGGAGDDTITGSGGADSVSGGEGDDVISGDAADLAEEFHGADQVSGDGGNDTLFGQGGADVISGGSGEDALSGGSGADTLTGGLGDDQIDGGAGSDVIQGGEGADVAGGGAGSDRLSGGASDDELFGDSDEVAEKKHGADRIFGDSGNDHLAGQGGSDQLVGGTGNDGLFGDSGDDELFGGQGDDTLVGGSGDDNLRGGKGQDSLVAGPGNDVLIGGAGTDLYRYSPGDGDVRIGDSGSNTLSFGFGIRVENVTLGVGSLEIGFEDAEGTIRIEGFDPREPLQSTGVDSFEFADGTTLTHEELVKQVGFTFEGDSSADALLGTDVQDELSGFGGDDEILGLDGNDTLDGGAGADRLVGGAGNDRFRVDATGDTVVENAAEGTDEVIATIDYTLGDHVENLTLDGDADQGVGNELDNRIRGNADADTLQGRSGSDVLEGGAGADRMAGGAGDDLFRVDDAGDTVVENAGEGTDEVVASVDHTLADNVEDLRLVGDADEGVGNDLANRIQGTDGADTLEGRGGDDTLEGGTGANVLRGGAGADKLRSKGGDDRLEGGAGSDELIADDFRETIIFPGSPTVSDDVLDGGAGADHMRGGLGDDTYFVDDPDDFVNEGEDEGNDTVIASVSYELSQETVTRVESSGFGFSEVQQEQQIETLRLVGDAERGVGNDTDNRVVGNDLGNELIGRGGTDTLVGGAGDDRFVVGFSDSTNVVEQAGQGEDTVVAKTDWVLGDHIENLELNAGVSGTGNELDNRLMGDDSGQELDGAGGADVTVGGGGNDVHIVRQSADRVVEEENGGHDTVRSEVDRTLSDHVENLDLEIGDATRGIGNELDNDIHGNDQANTLAGRAGSDAITGGKGDDSLTGGAGDDNLVGNAGADRMVGGTGDDEFFVDQQGDRVVENAGEGEDLVNSEIDFTLGDHLENLRLEPGDAVRGEGNELDNRIEGNGGDNRLVGRAGDDVIEGSFGTDTMVGGAGDDRFFADRTEDTVVEEANEGEDEVIAEDDFTLSENVENLTLEGSADRGTGNDLANEIEGNIRENTLTGLGGEDDIDGDAGDDLLEGGQGDDVLFGGRDRVREAEPVIVPVSVDTEGSGNFGVQEVFPFPDRLELVANADELRGGGGNDFLDGGSDNDLLSGGAGDDELFGGDDGIRLEGDDVKGPRQLPNDDRLFGGTGEDTLRGGTGDDILDGGEGIDRMDGGEGDDTFHVTGFSETVTIPDDGDDGSGGGDDGTGDGGSDDDAGGKDDGKGNQGVGNGEDPPPPGQDENFNDGPGTSPGNPGARGGRAKTQVQGAAAGDNGSTLETQPVGGPVGLASSSSAKSSGGGATYTTQPVGRPVAFDGSQADQASGSGASFTTQPVGNPAGLGGSLTAGSAFAAQPVGGPATMGSSPGVGGGAPGKASIWHDRDGPDGPGFGSFGPGVNPGDGEPDTRIVWTTDTVIEDAGEGFDKVFAEATFTLPAHVEVLELVGDGDFDGAGNDLDNEIIGNSGDNTLDGGADADRLVGGAGDDTFIVDRDDTVVERAGEGTDTVVADHDRTLGEHIERLRLAGDGDVDATGTTGDDVLIGSGGDNRLTTKGGNDTLAGRGGDDILDGGAGDDVYRYGVGDGADTILDGGGEDTVRFTDGLGADNVLARTAPTEDGETRVALRLVDQHGNELPGTGVRYVGRDTIERFAFEGGETATLDDLLQEQRTIEGGPGRDRIDGGAPDDTILGFQGPDRLRGGAGRDTLDGGRGPDELEGQASDDLLRGGLGPDRLEGGFGFDSAFGGQGPDHVNGGAQSDLLVGGRGPDKVWGGIGNDVVIGGRQPDLVDPGRGSDVLAFNAGDGPDKVNGRAQGRLTVSLGGGFERDELALSRSEDDLVLWVGSERGGKKGAGSPGNSGGGKFQTMGVGTATGLGSSNGAGAGQGNGIQPTPGRDRVILDDWFAEGEGEGEQPELTLQLIGSAAAGASEDAPNERFDLGGLARAADASGKDRWRLTDERLAEHLESSGDDVLGGNAALRYALDGRDGLGGRSFRSTLVDEELGARPQAPTLG